MKYFKQIEPHPKDPHFSFFHWHHIFTGILLSLIGFYFIFNYDVIFGIILILFGIWNIIDDAIQHAIQRKEINETGYYTTVSFLNWFPEMIFNKLKGKKNENVVS